MNPYNHPENNPHSFYFEICNDKTYDVVYTTPYSIADTPTEKDVEDVANHLVETIKEKTQALGWNHPDLFYRINFSSPLPSQMGMDLLFNIYHKTSKILDGKE